MTSIAKPVAPTTQTVSASSSDLPKRIGQWELVSLAAEGNLCRVYQARGSDGRSPSPAYAVKCLRPEWQNSPKALAALARETLVGREVFCPHVVPVLAANLTCPPHFVVMPWLTGSTLQGYLRAGRHVPVPVALWIIRQAAHGLDALYRSGWMHGDIKPSNLFISPEGHVTLIDLGFARRPEETGSVVNRCVVGTASYIAPEMITSALRADIRSDLYGLGAILYELLAGRPPFVARSLAEIATQHRQARPLGLGTLRPDLPIELVRLTHQLLSKDPLRRPQTPGELIERISELEIATFAQRSPAA